MHRFSEWLLNLVLDLKRDSTMKLLSHLFENQMITIRIGS